MRFSYAPSVREEFPERVSCVLHIEGIQPTADIALLVGDYQARAQARLTGQSEGELVEIKAWRSAFSKMGLKPTQYRCAAEALLRRFRKEGRLPSIHPLIDLCNAASIASAIPIAVFDADTVSGDLSVCHAEGSETYVTFGGETETPEPGEVIFADANNAAHARRWTNRQSRLSAITPETRKALIVAEALHETAHQDILSLKHSLSSAFMASFGVEPIGAVLAGPDFSFDSQVKMRDSHGA